MGAICDKANLGFEFTFTYDWTKNIGNKRIENMEEVKKQFLAFQNFIKNRLDNELGDITIEAENFTNPNYGNISMMKITFNGDFWITINLDPGVVEVQTKPSTWSQLSNDYRGIIESLFTACSGYHSFAPGTGGGHINVDFETGFDGKLENVLETIKNVENEYKSHRLRLLSYCDRDDEYYNPFISTSRLKVQIDTNNRWIGEDKGNTAGSDDYYADWLKMVGLNSKKISDFIKNHKMWVFTHPTMVQFYTKDKESSEFSSKLDTENEVLHYQAINLEHLCPDACDAVNYDSDVIRSRVEFRFFKAQTSWDDLEKHIKYLDTLVKG